MKRFKTAGVVCGVLLAFSLLLAHTHPFGNAGLYATAQRQTPLMAGTDITPEAQALLQKKCAECHSSEARPPFYGYFAPVSWLVESHVIAGREKLNFDAWGSYPEDRQQLLKAKIVQVTKQRTMPIRSYLLIHWNARITDADVKMLQAWARKQPQEDIAQSAPVVPPVITASAKPAAFAGPAKSTPASAALSASKGKAASVSAAAVPAATPLLEPDAARGAAIYQKRCAGCHRMDTNKDGPKLRGIYGKMSAEVPGFDYSDALKKAHIHWDETDLDRWLADPDAMVPDNDMSYRVRSAQERLDLIRYLKESAQ